jgi:hypothetical protein
MVQRGRKALNSAGRAEGGRRESFWQLLRWRAAQGWAAARATGWVLRCLCPWRSHGFGSPPRAEEEAARAFGGPAERTATGRVVTAARSAQSLCGTAGAWRL